MALVEARYRYRLRVSRPQAQALQGVFDTARFVWNTALGRWGDLWRHEGLYFCYADADKELTDWRGRFEWLGASPSVPQQQVLRDLYRGISAFFDKANPAGRPRFKPRKAGYATARWTMRGFGVSGTGLGVKGDDRLCLAVAGGRIGLRVVWSRPLPSVPTSVSVYRDRAGHYWASFVVRVEVPEAPLAPTGRASGLDVGLSTFATAEDPGADVPNPRYARAAAKALARSQANTARKVKGSKSRAKAKQASARLAARVANQRADFHHKAARGLVATYDRIGVEALAVKNLSAKGGRHKAGLNRSIADAGWSAFAGVLAWQAAKAGKAVVVLPARDTTQRCSSCGTKAKPRIELSDRVYRCRACGLVLSRDRNAARNLNPDRAGPGGGAEPSGQLPVGDDGAKPSVPAEILAA
ncbi:MAG: RNA-guided endonuclease InsQ/TnpB family protein [Steroidobacteraceae bacterium]